MEKTFIREVESERERIDRVVVIDANNAKYEQKKH